MSSTSMSLLRFTREMVVTLLGKHSLLVAATVGNSELVSEHITKGADLGARNLRGMSVLACAHGHFPERPRVGKVTGV